MPQATRPRHPHPGTPRPPIDEALVAGPEPRGTAGRRRFAQVSATVPWQEPLGAYRRLRHAGLEPLMLDGMGAHPEARHAYIACRWDLEVRVRGQDVAVRRSDGTVAAIEEAPLTYLHRILQESHHDLDEAVPFTGGWIGYFGYEAHRLFEPTLPPSDRPAGTPDIVLRRCWSVAAFDRRTRTATLHAAHPDSADTARRDLSMLRDTLAGSSLGPEDRRAPPSSRVPTADPTAASAAGGVPDAPGQGGKMPSWETSMDRPRFEDAVRGIKARVQEGDLFQANIATRFRTACDQDPADLFAALAKTNPSPYMALMEFDDHALVSGSPEQLFAVADGRIRSRPIAGTRPRGTDDASDQAMEEELVHDPKERAEHTMLVDLVRNDLARVCRPGSVAVPERMSVERYRHVMHLVSRVEGDLRVGTGFLDWMAALFPGGTITGAPKHRACLRIRDTEPLPRGPYTGSAGFLSWSGNAHWNILIRTLVLQAGAASIHAGSGIVADSVPHNEWQEAGHKAQALLDAASGQDHGGDRTRLGEVIRHGAWHPPAATLRFPEARVLVVDNYDSFTYNLVDQLGALGAQVEVVRNDADLHAVDPGAFTHLVLSPGPGHPDDAGGLVDLVRTLRGRLPILGVCLGHQAIARACGGTVVQDAPVHGKAATIVQAAPPLWPALPATFQAARYHSLTVPPSGVPQGFQVAARLTDGRVMAMWHPEDRIMGLQFHPESVGTPAGLDIMAAFLGQGLDRPPASARGRHGPDGRRPNR